MKKLTIADIKPLPEYEPVRKEFRNRMIDLKRQRRVSLGDIITLAFENRDTMIYQIQEMMRTEHLFEQAKIQEEIDTYNELVPDAGELSATLFIEITDSEKIKETLDKLQGIDNGTSLYLELGPDRVTGRFEEGHSKEDKLSAVHYVRFHFSPEQRSAFRNLNVNAAFAVDHPFYKTSAPISKAVRESLIEDLEETE